MKTTNVILILASLAFSGCNSTVTDFVKGGLKPITNIVEFEANGPIAMKVSPGRVVSSDNGVNLEANITPTKRIMTGGGISAEVSISRQRMSLQ